jgi:drug/metabolite transporter superfamily protein YnfA
MLLAAAFEVGGDALIRKGITGGGLFFVVLGFVVLGSYGVLVNLSGLDFTRMIGAYIGWFTLVSMLFGRFFFGDRGSTATWVGVSLVLVGSLVIQLGTQKEPKPATAPGPAQLDVRS